MGGEPMPMEGQEELPFSLDELQTYNAEDDSMTANEGGMVSGFNEGGLTDSDTPKYPSGASSVFTMPSTVFKTFVNEAGLRMYIRFVNGVPMSPIPTGYTEEGAAEVSAPVQTPVVQEDEGNTELENNPFVKPFEIMTKAELARFAAEISKTKVYNAITGIPGMIGFGAKAQEKRWADYVSKVNDMGTKGQKDFVNGLQTNINAGDRDANMAIAKVNNGGKDVTHLDIMTGDVGYLKKTRVSNIGISDADMLEDLAGGSSTSGDGTTPYIDDDDDDAGYEDGGDIDDDDDVESTAELTDRINKEKEARKKAAENKILLEKRKRDAERKKQNDADGDRDSSNQGGYDSESVQESVDYSQSGYEDAMNKGGLASRKNKKKK